MIKEINQTIYEGLLKGDHKRTPNVPKIDLVGLTPGEVSKRLIEITKRNLRSETMSDFLQGLFTCLYCSPEREYKILIVTKVTTFISRLYHKDFKSLEDLYLFLKTNKHRSIFKDVCENLLLYCKETIRPQENLLPQTINN